ncbi:MAG: S8 family serine peptidase, partial [bacterium]
MKRITSYLMKAFIVLLLLSVTVGISSPVWAQEAPLDTPPPVTSLMVKLNAGLTPEQQTAVITLNGGALKSSIPQLRIFVVEVPESDAPAVIQSYQSDPAVQSVEINKTRKTQAIQLPSDAEYANQWSLPKIGWDWVYNNVSPNGGATVAILDTGVDAQHPELAQKVIDGFSVFDTIDTTTKGKTDPNGHGTMLAGIVAAQTNNTLGIAGVAYTGVQIIPVTVLGADGTGQDSDVIVGLLWAVEQKADVILMGFSNPGFSQNLQDAIDYAWAQGAVLVAATGNDGTSQPTYPAGDRAVVGVTATDENDALLGGSNYGPAVFLAAPGKLVFTTAVGPVENGDSSYTLISGTSSSAAVVAGVAAFMKAVDSTLTNGVIVGRLARSADPAGTQEQTGNGRVNMARALGSTGDMGLDPIQTVGVAPEGIDGTGLGNGGPFVGPYVAAATVNTVTAVARTSGSQPSTYGSSLGVTATVTKQGAGGGAITVGNVEFRDGGTNCTSGTVVQTATAVNSSGQVTYTTSTLATGSHTIRACYLGITSGVDTYKTSSAAIDQTIDAKPVTVTADAKSKVYGDPDPALTYASSDPSATFSGALTRAPGETVAGSPYAITQGTLLGTGNYTIGSFVGANFTITPKPVTVTPTSGQSKVYGTTPDPALTYTLSETVAVTGALARTAGEDVGNYAINLGDLASTSGNYSLILAAGTVNFAITPKPVTVTPTSGQSKVYGTTPDPALTYTLSETVAVTGALARTAGED